MREMVIRVTRECDGCNFEKINFDLQPALRPTDKPKFPFDGWSIDLITNLDPISPEGYRHCVVAVCCFSKWCEIMPIKNKTSDTLATWFHTNIVCRYGKPRWVRVDSGREFMGEFGKLCQGLGVTVRKTSAMHPRSNGQVERFNKEIKIAIRKYCGLHPGTSWFDWIPDVLCGLRMLVAKSHGYSPYFLVYKQSPILPGRPMEVSEEHPISLDTDPWMEG